MKDENSVVKARLVARGYEEESQICIFQIVSQFPDYFAFFKKFLSFTRISQIPVNLCINHIFYEIAAVLSVILFIRYHEHYNRSESVSNFMFPDFYSFLWVKFYL